VAPDLTQSCKGLGLCNLRNERPTHETVLGQEVLPAVLGGGVRGSGSKNEG
jgi:hypothetical protein